MARLDSVLFEKYLNAYVRLWSPSQRSRQVSQGQSDRVSRAEGKVTFLLRAIPSQVDNSNNIRSSVPKITAPSVLEDVAANYAEVYFRA